MFGSTASREAPAGEPGVCGRSRVGFSEERSHGAKIERYGRAIRRLLRCFQFYASGIARAMWDQLRQGEVVLASLTGGKRATEPLGTSICGGRGRIRRDAYQGPPREGHRRTRGLSDPAVMGRSTFRGGGLQNDENFVVIHDRAVAMR